MKVEIDKRSGFCFGVIKAISRAEELLAKEKKLYCLGQIVHNGVEVSRLEKMGLITISKEQFEKLKNCSVLIHAHGEPPETYEIAKQNNIELIDETCPVVLKLQERIQKKYLELKKKGGKILIYGKEGHAEVIGLMGQTESDAVVVKESEDLEKVDFSGPVCMFSQTTMSKAGFDEMANEVKKKVMEWHGIETGYFEAKNTVCGHVSCREPALESFSKQHGTIIFVSGKNSSNGKLLFEICKKNNPSSYFIGSPNEIDISWFANTTSVGVCGATSTPLWQMEEVAKRIHQMTE